MLPGTIVYIYRHWLTAGNDGSLTRGQVLSVREKEFVEAARTLEPRWSNYVRHILPNVVGPLVVAETLAIPGYISTEAFLSFMVLVSTRRRLPGIHDFRWRQG